LVTLPPHTLDDDSNNDKDNDTDTDDDDDDNFFLDSSSVLF
jgi:hypothetical protein